MSEANPEELIDRLLETDGVTEVHVSLEVTATVRRENTGEVDDVFNQFRKRTVSEEELKELGRDLGWNPLGTIDVVGDYILKDRFTKRVNMEAEDG